MYRTPSAAHPFRRALFFIDGKVRAARLCRRKPGAVRAALMKLAQQELGPGIDAGVHFAPRYNPWDQRACLVPDGDLFAAMRLGKASVVTDEIETFTEKGLELRSGCELGAAFIVTATGLKMRLMGGMAMDLDGESVDFATRTTYKGMMFSDVPNLAGPPPRIGTAAPTLGLAALKGSRQRQGRASSTILNGVSVALRTAPNPPCMIADESLAKPACAPNAAPTG
jgi:cation diffusion facilitator CzcD-associated flavoprotein CzcO